jgi:DNA-binding MarR family transcriptional regulator
MFKLSVSRYRAVQRASPEEGTGMRPATEAAHRQVALYLKNHPELSFQAIAARLGISISSVTRIARLNGLSWPRTLKVHIPKEEN